MFERIKKINGHEYRYLVKSVRVDGKMKQKVIKYLGKVIPNQEDPKLPEIKAILEQEKKGNSLSS